MLAAALLGPTAAIALVARMPGLVTGPRDAVVAAIYLGILFGASLAAAAFVLSLGASWLASRTASSGERAVRRARRLAVTAGVLVTAACLAYLTLWWKTASPAFAWSSPIWTTVALAVAAAISVLLGHAVTVTALAVTMARPGQDVLSARVPGATWKASIIGGAIAFAGAVALLFAAAGADRPGDRLPTPLPVRSGEPIVVLAIDGFDAAAARADPCIRGRRAWQPVSDIRCGAGGAHTIRLARSGAAVDHDCDGRAAGSAWRRCARDAQRHRPSRPTGRRFDRPGDWGGHRSAAFDATSHCQQLRASREDVLGNSRSGRPSNCRRQLVGDVARRRRQRNRLFRSRRAAAGTGRGARRGARPAPAVRLTAIALAGDPGRCAATGAVLLCRAGLRRSSRDPRTLGRARRQHAANRGFDRRRQEPRSARRLSSRSGYCATHAAR